MNTVYGILGSLAIMACLAGWGSWEAGKVDKIQGQLDSLKASYATAAAQAKLDAAQKEATDLANLKSQSSVAISQATQQATEAQTKLQAYLAKGKASKEVDLGHKCFSVPIPADEIPK